MCSSDLVDGLEVLRFLRSHEPTRRIPVIVLSSSREERDIRESYLAGANSYVVKPVDFQEFSRVVKLVGAYWAQVNELPDKVT